MSTYFRKLENGYLIAPRRGEAPPPPEGYEAAFGDPFVFLPKLNDCKYRGSRIIKRSCCDPIQKLTCSLNGSEEFTTRLKCQGCIYGN